MPQNSPSGVYIKGGEEPDERVTHLSQESMSMSERFGHEAKFDTHESNSSCENS